MAPPYCGGQATGQGQQIRDIGDGTGWSDDLYSVTEGQQLVGGGHNYRSHASAQSRTQGRNRRRERINAQGLSDDRQ